MVPDGLDDLRIHNSTNTQNDTLKNKTEYVCSEIQTCAPRLLRGMYRGIERLLSPDDDEAHRNPEWPASI